jgi:glycine/D-amino acid oxidase-like deaminating enzyme
VFPRLSNTYNIKYTSAGRVDYLNPRPDGGIIVGGGKWTFAQDRDLWYNNWDDSALIPEVRPHFDNYMQRYFRGWEGSGAVVDHLWTGIMAYTADELPIVGEIPGTDGHYVVAGFNGGGMDRIFLSARGVAAMAVNRVSFKDSGVPAPFEPTQQRLSQDDAH